VKDIYDIGIIKRANSPKYAHSCQQTIVQERKNATSSSFLNEAKMDNFNLSLFKPGKFRRDFKELQVIYYGDLTLVCKVANRKNCQTYAIKKIPMNIDEIKNLKELKILAKFKSDYVVKYNSAWIEDNYMLIRGYNHYKETDISLGHAAFDPMKSIILHIQMEYCSETLTKFMEKIKKEMKLKENELLTPICYYIAGELSFELIECVNYLHKQNPPIIHRDLKPENILITDGINGRFVKIADFGLSTIHEFSDQSHTYLLGTLNYIAPEVLGGQRYDTKADIFSLGVVMQNIFSIKNNE
jgi:serine/threonine protein kinase